MNPTLDIDVREFQEWNRRHLAQTKRALHKASNKRMFYVALRAFAILPPKNPQAERNKIREYMTHQVAERGRITQKGHYKRHGRSRQLQRRHLIAQVRAREKGEPGKYGTAMSKAAASVLRRAVGSVGYLKSPLVKTMQKLNGTFTQFGFRTKKADGKEVPANSALLAIRNDYGLSLDNVGMHKGAKARVSIAVQGFSPSVSLRISIGVADNQFSKVLAEYNAAFARAFREETEQIKKHIGDTVQDAADEADKR